MHTHSIIHTIQRPELRQNMPYLSRVSPATTEFRKILELN